MSVFFSFCDSAILSTSIINGFFILVQHFLYQKCFKWLFFVMSTFCIHVRISYKIQSMYLLLHIEVLDLLFKVMKKDKIFKNGSCLNQLVKYELNFVCYLYNDRILGKLLLSFSWYQYYKKFLSFQISKEILVVYF